MPAAFPGTPSLLKPVFVTDRLPDISAPSRPSSFNCIPMNALSMIATMSAKIAAANTTGFSSFIREEFPLFISLPTAGVLLAIGNAPLENLTHPFVTGLLFLWLFGIVLWSAICVARHADFLALKCGEPYGTLILTLAAISIEVAMISTAMLHGANNPTLARDAMFAVIMIA